MLNGAHDGGETADHALLEVDKNFFASAYLADYDKAIVHGEKALALLDGLGNTEEETIRMIANMSQNYILQGDLRQVDALIQKGIPLLKTSQSDVYNALFVFAWSFLRLAFTRALMLSASQNQVNIPIL